jgi:hypothetical protein
MIDIDYDDYADDDGDDMNLLSERPPVSYTVVVKKGDEVIKYYHF